jgi:CRISPR-associated protein Csb1
MTKTHGVEGELMPVTLNLAELSAAISGGAAALRSITTLQPVEGEGGKVFPATYSGGKYALEKRRLRGDDGSEREVECVLLNSVQSEANHAELALLQAIERGRIRLPLIEVDFSEANKQFKKDLPNLTSLEVPHRLADAILRDSITATGTRFSKSEYAARWGRANLWNATAVYEMCPTALVFGMWGSPEKPGGLGAKFERAYISEIVGVDALAVDKRSGFRVDPLGASSKVTVVQKGDGGFQLAGEKAKNALRPSELNHGNIVFENSNGGIRCRFAEQTTVVSFGALRKLRFPVDGSNDTGRDDAGRTVLAAIGICAGVLASERGTSLRSRCHLRPVEPRAWEMLDQPGAVPKTYTIDGKAAVELLNAAVAAAKAVGLTWMKEKLMLKPTPELIDLVRKSQEVAAVEDGAEAS